MCTCIDGMHTIKYMHVQYIISEYLYVYISVNQVSKHRLHSFPHVFIPPCTSPSLHVLRKPSAVQWTFPEWSLGL